MFKYEPRHDIVKTLIKKRKSFSGWSKEFEYIGELVGTEYFRKIIFQKHYQRFCVYHKTRQRDIFIDGVAYPATLFTETEIKDE